MTKAKKFILTVVVPTYNRSNILKKTLQIFIKNKNPNICFLVLNNNSKDGTIDLIKKLIKKDKRIILKSHKKNIGAANNFRYGLLKSKTPYVCLVSDDDLLKGKYFDYCIEIFQKNRDVGIIHHEYGKIITSKIKNYKVFDAGSESSINVFNHSSIIAGLAFRRSLINFKKYPTDKKLVYSYMSQVLNITKKYRYAKILNSAFFPSRKRKNFKSLIEDGYKIQMRPYDYGIIEMWNYILKSQYNNFIKMMIMQKKIYWISNVVSVMPKKYYNKFLINYEKNIGSYFRFFYLYIFFKNYDLKILFFLFKRIFNPRLFPFLFFEILLMFKYIFNKILKLK